MRRIVAAGILALAVALLLISVVAAAGPPTINILDFEIDRERISVPPDWGRPLPNG